MKLRMSYQNRTIVWESYLVVLEQKFGRPPLLNVRIQKVGPRGRAGPAPTVQNIAVFIFDEESFLLGIAVNWVARVGFNVGIDDGYQFAAVARQIVYHVDWVGKFGGVPCEVAFVVGVLDVEPHYVHGYLVFFEAQVYAFDVLLVVIIPSTLSFDIKKC